MADSAAAGPFVAADARGRGDLDRAAPKRSLMLTATSKPRWAACCASCRPRSLASVPIRSTAACWWRSDFGIGRAKVVVAAADDAEAIVLGSSLAARMSIPLLIRERSESRTSLARTLADLGVEEMLAAVSDADHAPAWANSTRSTRCRSSIRGRSQDRASWIWSERSKSTRFWSPGRRRKRSGGRVDGLADALLEPGSRAPIVLGHAASAGGRRGRRGALDQGPSPATANDHGSGRLRFDRRQFRRISDDNAPAAARRRLGNVPSRATGEAKNKYQLNTEPLVPTDAAKPAAFGVGRIPLQSLEDASVLFARGLIRERPDWPAAGAAADGGQFEPGAASAAAVRNDQPRDRRGVQELRRAGGRFLRQAGRQSRGPGRGEERGIDYLRRAFGLSGLVRRPVGASRHGAGQLLRGGVGQP